jgi:hypothetical protein
MGVSCCTAAGAHVAAWCRVVGIEVSTRCQPCTSIVARTSFAALGSVQTMRGRACCACCAGARCDASTATPYERFASSCARTRTRSQEESRTRILGLCSCSHADPTSLAKRNVPPPGPETAQNSRFVLLSNSSLRQIAAHREHLRSHWPLRVEGESASSGL